MNTAAHFPPPFHNALPLRFPTWVACYDSIPESQRHAVQFVFYQAVTKKQFARLYGYPQPLQVIGKVEYSIDREWLLARIGEELLATRWTVSEWQEVRRAVRRAGAPADDSLDLHIGNRAFPRLLRTLIPDRPQ